MDIKEALTFDGLKYFYTKYIKPLKTGAFSTVVNNATTTVANTVLDGRMGKTLADKDANLQSQINTLNSSLTDEEFQVIYQGESSVHCYAKLKNGYVTIKGESYGELEIPSRSYYDLTTLPEKYRPNGVSHFFVSNLGGGAKIFGAVHMDGKIKLYSDIESGYWAYCFTYPI